MFNWCETDCALRNIWSLISTQSERLLLNVKRWIFTSLWIYVCKTLLACIFFGLAPMLYIFLNTVQWFCLHNLHIVLLILSFTINHSFIIHYGVSCFASATENIVHTSVSTPVQTPKTPKNRSPMPEDRIVQEIIEPARAGLQHNHPTSPYGKTSFILLFILLCFSVVSFLIFFFWCTFLKSFFAVLIFKIGNIVSYIIRQILMKLV